MPHLAPWLADQPVAHPCLVLGKQADDAGAAIAAERLLRVMLCFLTHLSRTTCALTPHRMSSCQSVHDSAMLVRNQKAKISSVSARSWTQNSQLADMQ